METTLNNPAQLPGWGIDADPKNDPTYPMRHRMNAGQDPDIYHRPPLQPVDMEVLKSIERPSVSAVFGTSSAPSGLSGVIRRAAFKYSESVYPHWLPLLLADRVNMVEGVLGDLAHGRVPNIFAERGARVEWKYNRPAFVTKLAVISALTAGAIVWLSAKDRPARKRHRH